jgi:hypothetical protein
VTNDDIKINHYSILKAKRFNHWVTIHDLRSSKNGSGKKGRKNFINFFQTILGPLGERWTFQKQDDFLYIIKIDNERDLLFFLLKFKNR